MQLNDVELNTVAVLRYALNPGEKAPELTVPWAEIKAELMAQSVAFLPADAVAELGLSNQERLDYTLACANSIRGFHRILSEQDRLEKALEGIPHVILKGTAAAMYYPRPELRQMGDIDVLVMPENYERAKALLTGAGYSMDADGDRHTGFDAESGVKVELHQKFSSSDNRDQNEVLDGLVYSGLAVRELKELCGHAVPVLPGLENGLVLLGHINQHLSSGLGLRQIIDWMMYVRARLDDEFWNREFAAAADAIGMKKLAEVAALLCKRHFGLDGISWCDGADGSLADELLEYVFDKGNFGKKHEYSSRTTVSVLHRLNNPILFFRYLTAGGMVHWEAARKYKILKPFAWIYQLGHLIKMGLKRKVAPSRFIEEARQSRRESNLLERLNVTRK